MAYNTIHQVTKATLRSNLVDLESGIKNDAIFPLKIPFDSPARSAGYTSRVKDSVSYLQGIASLLCFVVTRE
jgi:hypothetical protein